MSTAASFDVKTVQTDQGPALVTDMQVFYKDEWYGSRFPWVVGSNEQQSLIADFIKRQKPAVTLTLVKDD